MRFLAKLFGLEMRRPPLPVGVPWEVYQTKAEAYAALSKDGREISDESPPNPLTDCSLLDIVEANGVTSIRFCGRLWHEHSMDVHRQLRLLGDVFGRDRFVLDFAGEKIVGPASLSCIFAMYRSAVNTYGRFALCDAIDTLLKVFQVMRAPLAYQSKTNPRVLTCGVHGCDFNRTSVPVQAGEFPWSSQNADSGRPFANQLFYDNTGRYAAIKIVEVNYCPQCRKRQKF